MDQDRAFKDAVYEQIARLAKAVAHPKRLELLDLLCQGPMTVEELSRKADMPMANASQHLQHLKSVRLVGVNVDGTYRRYHLMDDGGCNLYRVLRDTAEQYSAELRETVANFFHVDNGFEAVSPDDLARRLGSGEVLLLDVRPVEEYQAGHIAGALSVPLKEIHARLADLPTDRTIVAYCRGPHCVLSLHAAEILRDAGFPVYRLAEGIGDWRALGLPVAGGERCIAT